MTAQSLWGKKERVMHGHYRGLWVTSLAEGPVLVSNPISRE